MVENAIQAAMAIACEQVTEFQMVREFDRSIVSQGGQRDLLKLIWT